MDDSSTTFSAGGTAGVNRQNFLIQSARQTRTFCFNALNGDDEVEQTKAK